MKCGWRLAITLVICMSADADRTFYSMKLAVCGLNHRTAPVQLRDRVAIGSDRLDEALSVLRSNNLIKECMIVSTCNRTEIYTVTDSSVSPNGKPHPAVSFLLDFHGMTLPEIEPYLYYYEESDAVSHIFKVVCGLDSMVLGENQIIGQVRDAFSKACKSECTGYLMNRLAHAAFRVGKEVRTETTLNEGSLSVSYAACDLASNIFGSLSATRVLVVGAGETGELVARNMKKRGVENMTVTNRTRERAESLAAKLECNAIPFGDLYQGLLDTDIVVSCTASPHYVLRADTVARVMAERPPGESLFLIDLAVPRDIEENVGDIDGVYLHNIDDLREIVEKNSARRNEARIKAMKIVEYSVKQFNRWRQSLLATPTICGVQNALEQIRRDELARVACKISEEELARLDEVTSSIVSRISKVAIANIRNTVNQSEDPTFLENVRRLFGIELK